MRISTGTGCVLLLMLATCVDWTSGHLLEGKSFAVFGSVIVAFCVSYKLTKKSRSRFGSLLQILRRVPHFKAQNFKLLFTQLQA